MNNMAPVNIYRRIPEEGYREGGVLRAQNLASSVRRSRLLVGLLTDELHYGRSNLRHIPTPQSTGGCWFWGYLAVYWFIVNLTYFYFTLSPIVVAYHQMAHLRPLAYSIFVLLFFFRSFVRCSAIPVVDCCSLCCCSKWRFCSKCCCFFLD